MKLLEAPFPPPPLETSGNFAATPPPSQLVPEQYSQAVTEASIGAIIVAV